MKGGYMTPEEYTELVKASKKFNDIDGTIAEKMDKSTKHDYIQPTDGTFEKDFKLLDKKEQDIRIENFKTENDKLTKVDEYPYKNPIVKPMLRPIIDPIIRPIVQPIVDPIVRPIVQPIYYDYDRREKEKLIEMIIDLIKNKKYGKTVIEQQIDKVIENYNNNTRDPDDNIRKIAEQMLKNYTSKTSNKKPIKQKSKKKKSIKSKKKKKSKKSKKNKK